MRVVDHKLEVLKALIDARQSLYDMGERNTLYAIDSAISDATKAVAEALKADEEYSDA